MFPNKLSLVSSPAFADGPLATVASCPWIVALEKTQVDFSGAGLFERSTIETPAILRS